MPSCLIRSVAVACKDPYIFAEALTHHITRYRDLEEMGLRGSTLVSVMEVGWIESTCLPL